MWLHWIMSFSQIVIGVDVLVLVFVSCGYYNTNEDWLMIHY